MAEGPPVRRLAAITFAVVVGVLVVVGVSTFFRFRPAAITLGPNTTIYFRDDPPLSTRVHEAVHRRQMRNVSTPGRIWKALRYNFDYGYRLDEEAEAKAAELCLQIHRFSTDLPDYTTARSRSQAQAYRAWTWERSGLRVPDRVGEVLAGGDNCHRLLEGVRLDLPPDRALSESDELKLATFHFLRAYGSTSREVAGWKARLTLAGLTDPAHWELPDDMPPFGLVEVGRGVAPLPDTTITAEEAGWALHRIAYSHAERMYLQVSPPLPGYRGRRAVLEGEGLARTGVPLEEWPDRLLQQGLDGELTPGAVAWLEELSRHPVNRDFEVFARAPSADILGTRYRWTLVKEQGGLVLSELEPVRDAFRVQWGRAALAAQAGELERADSILRTVVAGALRVVDDAPFELDVLEGIVFLDQGLRSLHRLAPHRNVEPVWWTDYEAVSPERWIRGMRWVLFSGDRDQLYRAMPALALDPGIPHAFKQAAYGRVVLADVCLELLHGEAERRSEHGRWRAAVETGLVRRESDGHLLELVRSRVRRLMSTSMVPPDAVCAPGRGVRSGARLAIMLAPPGPPGVLASDED